MTKKPHFGLGEGQELFDKSPIAGVSEENIRKNTAQCTLNHGEELLLTGLNGNRRYRFTEKLDDALMNESYTLKEAVHVTGEEQFREFRPENFNGADF